MASQRAKSTTYQLKRTPPTLVNKFCNVISDNLHNANVEPFFGDDVLLIPVPGHSRLRNDDDFWGPRNLCKAMCDRGLAANWSDCLRRATTVNKAAASAPEDRPDYQTHFDSMVVEFAPSWHGRVTVVDDVVTKGATLLAAVNRIAESLTEAESVQGYALVRSLYQQEVGSFIDPVCGTITLYKSGKVHREP